MEKSSITGILKNSSPLRFDEVGTEIGQLLEHAVPEVLVGKVLAKMFGKSEPGWFELFFIHAFSMPFIGGLGAPLLMDIRHAKLEDSYGQQIRSGAAGVPAVFLAQYILSMWYDNAGLLHMPKVSFRSVLLTTISKIVTRSLVTTASKIIPEGVADQYNALQGKFDHQITVSNLNMDKN